MIRIRLRKEHLVNDTHLRKEIITWLDEEIKTWHVEYARDDDIWWLILAENKHAVHFRMKW